MRIRAGFVSNSSTSSFVIFFPSADNVRACDALKQGIDAAADEGLLDDLVASCFEAQREYDIDSDYDAGDSDSGGEDELQRAQEELELQQIDDEEERERERARLKMLKRVCLFFCFVVLFSVSLWIVSQRQELATEYIVWLTSAIGGRGHAAAIVYCAVG